MFQRGDIATKLCKLDAMVWTPPLTYPPDRIGLRMGNPILASDGPQEILVSITVLLLGLHAFSW
jgi:hypothetical protein